MKKERNFIYVADEIIKIIEEECDFSEEKITRIIEKIEKAKADNMYKSPELQYVSWEELSNILRANFLPINSKWKTKLMLIFNNLKGTVEDYWDDGTNSLKEVSE